MKYIKQNIKQNAKRALSWLTALTLVLALVPVFTVNANASGVTPRINAPLDLGSTSANVGPVDNATFRPSTTDIDGSAEGWRWYHNGGAGHEGRVLVLSGINFDNSNPNNALVLLPDTTVILEGDNKITQSSTTNHHAIFGRGPGHFTFTGTGKLTLTTTAGGSTLGRGIDLTNRGNLLIENCEIEIISTGRGITLSENHAEVTIKNATVNIDSGESAITAIGGSGNFLTIIDGSRVTADAGRSTASSGQQFGFHVTNITIQDSVVYAYGGGTAGGIGINGTSTLVIENSTVTAAGASNGHGISSPNITIETSDVRATGGPTGSGIVNMNNNTSAVSSIISSNIVASGGTTSGDGIHNSRGILNIDSSIVTATGGPTGTTNRGIYSGGAVNITSSVITAQGGTDSSGIRTRFGITFTVLNSHIVSHSGNGTGADMHGFWREAGCRLLLDDSTITASGTTSAFSHAPALVTAGGSFNARTNNTTDDPGGALDSYTFSTDHKFVHLVEGDGGTPVSPGAVGPQTPGGEGSVRFTNPDFDENNNEPKEDVDVQARIILLIADIYRIDIAWGAMKFVFDINSPAWDYEDREYAASQGIWLIDNGEEPGSLEGYLDGENNKVTVTNRSNDGVDVGFDFELENPNIFNDGASNRVQGNFFATNELAQAGALILDTDTTPVPNIFAGTHAIESADARDIGNINTFPSESVFFAFSGTPDKDTFDSFQRAGIITVTITPADDATP